MSCNNGTVTKCLASIICAGTLLCSNADATIVQFQTNLGDFEVNLYDESTPATVANFLAYVEAGSYQDTIIHRSVSGFVVQGGGFLSSGSAIETSPPVVNEPVFSNVRATIAMAKLGNNANSATSQWFFNLGNNSANLDNQNGGFTVFGEVVSPGMDVVDAIAAVPRYNIERLVPAFSSVPLQDYDNTSDQPADEANYIIVYDVLVLDAAVDTAADLSPAPTTKKRKKKSGSTSGLALLSLIALGIFLNRKKYA